MTEIVIKGMNSGRKIFFLSIAAATLLIAAVFCAWNTYLLLASDKAEGVIASVSIRQTGGKTPASFYDISAGFRVGNRQIYTRVATMIFNAPYVQGDRVVVYYDPEKPDNAFLNSLGTLWLFPAIILSIGLISLMAARPGSK